MQNIIFDFSFFISFLKLSILCLGATRASPNYINGRLPALPITVSREGYKRKLPYIISHNRQSFSAFLENELYHYFLHYIYLLFPTCLYYDPGWPSFQLLFHQIHYKTKDIFLLD